MKLFGLAGENSGVYINPSRIIDVMYYPPAKAVEISYGDSHLNVLSYETMEEFLARLDAYRQEI